MQRYTIKSSKNREDYMEIQKETPEGYYVRIVRSYDGYHQATESFMERHLFEMCLKTAYLVPVARTAGVLSSSVA